jgi:hypothetical protein
MHERLNDLLQPSHASPAAFCLLFANNPKQSFKNTQLVNFKNIIYIILRITVIILRKNKSEVLITIIV